MIFSRVNRRFYTVFIIMGLGFMTVAAVLNSNTPPPEAHSNAPGESNCTGCHSGSLNPVPANLNNFTLTGNIPAGGYIPDSVYSLTVSYSQSGINKFGFQMTSIRADNNNGAGTYTAGIGSNVGTANVSGSVRSYIQHSSNGTAGAGSRSWTFTWRAPAANVDTISFYAVINSSNSNNSSSGDQIYAKVFKFPVSNQLPTASIATSKTIVCQNDTITYYGSGTNNPTGYRWKFQSGTPQIVTTQNVVRTMLFVGTFIDTLWVSNNKGESQPVRVITEVVSRPTASITSVSPGNTVCIGDSVTLTANSGTGLRYSWNTGNTRDTLQQLVVYQSGSYNVTVSNSNNCFRTSSNTNLNFIARPNVSLQSNVVSDTLCTGDTLKITATAGFVSYQFFNGTNLLQSGSSNTLNITQSGSYSIHVIADNGNCTERSTNTINKVIKTFLPAPTISCGNRTTTSVSFNWNKVIGAVGYEVSVDNGQFQATSDTFWQVVSLTFNTPVVLRVRAIQSGACSAGLLGIQTCTSLPCSQFSYNLDVSADKICEGDSVIVSLNNLSLSNYRISFNGSTPSLNTQYTWYPTASDKVFTLDISDLNSPSCPVFTIRDSVKVEVPKSIMLNLIKNKLCLGEALDINSTPGFVSYVLNVNGSAFDSNAIGTFRINNPNDGMSFEIIGKGEVCLNFSNSESVAVNTPRKPGFTLVSNGLEHTFTDTTQGIESRIWNLGDNTFDTAKVVTHSYATSGNFLVRLYTMDLNGCSDSSNQTVLSTTGISSLSVSNGISVYPNPTNNRLFVISEFPLEQAEVWNNLGQQLYQGLFNSASIEIDVRAYPAGVYYLKVCTVKGEHNRIKFIIK